MTPRVKTAWAEYLIGVFMLAMAVAALVSPILAMDSFGLGPRLSVVVFVLVASLAFSAHLFRRRPGVHAVMVAVIAAASIFGAYVIGRRGAYDMAIWSGLFGFIALVVGLGPEADRDGPDLLPLAFGAYLIVTSLSAGAVDMATDDLVRQHLLQAVGIGDAAAIPLFFIAGAALCWTELAAKRRLKIAATVVGFAAMALLAADRFASGFMPGLGISLAVGAVFLLLSRVRGDLTLVIPDDELARASEEHRLVYEHEQIGEVGVWTIIACSAVYILIASSVKFLPFFVSLFLAAGVELWLTHLTPLRYKDARHYMTGLLCLIGALLMSVYATGGPTSPFALFSFTALIASSVVVPSRWILLPAIELVGYFTADAAVRWKAGAGDPIGPASSFFVIGSLTIAGTYAGLVSRRREKAETALKTANERLSEAASLAESERLNMGRQSDDLKTLNADLLETRTALMNVLEDVEESKRRIEADYRRDSAIFEAVGEGLVAAGADGSVVLFNSAAAKILRVAHDEAIGKPVRSLLRISAEDSNVPLAAPFDLAFSGKTGSFPEEAVVIDAEEKRVPVSGTVTPFLDERGEVRGIVAVFRDVTEERELDRQKSGFISVASHQLRTPLSAMRWSLELLLGGDIGALKPKQKDFLNDIYGSTARMIHLVEDLLNVTRVEAGKTPAGATADAGELLRAVGDEYGKLAKAKKLSFVVSIPPSLPIVDGDPVALRQAISNLAANAVNYTPPGGQVSLRAYRRGGEVIVEVEDTGIGIPQDQQHRLFERFFRAQNAVAKETVGSGLGLYIAKQIIEAHGGRLWFASKEGKGSTFFASLPVSRKDATLGEKSR